MKRTAATWFLRITTGLLGAFAMIGCDAFAQGAKIAIGAGHVHARVHALDDRPIEGALLRAGRLRGVTDARGDVSLALPAGPIEITITRLGFLPDTLGLAVRADMDTSVDVALVERAIEAAAIEVSTTRTHRRLQDEPERVEVLSGEDVSEKSQMRPGDLKGLLAEMSGVRVQATAPGLGAASLRIQGLRGQYTEVLADGLPLYGASAPEFGLVQIPPLDLDQAEVIKGAATALYGPSALGGVLNLISRRPRPGIGEHTLLLNATTRNGSDGVVWLSRRPSERWGWTLLGGVHQQRKVDVDHDGWSDIPGFTRGEMRPRLYWSGEGGRSVMATAGATAEDREGGATSPVPSGFPFFEGLTTRRGDLGVVANFPLAAAGVLTVKTAVSGEWQRHRADQPSVGAVPYRDHRSTLFAEVTWLAARGRVSWIAGGVFRQDAYRNRDLRGFGYTYRAPALLAQGTLRATDWFSASASGRLDIHDRFGTIASPRVSLLVHRGRALEARLSAGTGFAAPTPFTEETQAIQLARLLPPTGLRAERARSASLDVTGRRGPLELNGTLFASAIDHAVLLQEIPDDTTGMVMLVNAAGPTRTQGAELFAIYNHEPIMATAYVAWLHATEISAETGARHPVPLSPTQSAGLDVAWEDDESGTRVGVELFYAGRQSLDHDPRRAGSVPYATLGVLASRRVGRVLLSLNLDNLGDVRQTRWERVVLPVPGPGGRAAVDEWAPLEGRTINVAARLNL